MDHLLQLLERWRGGDQQAATDLYQRYAGRLIALARDHLSAKYAARLDAEDVIQSVVRSFFLRARDGRFHFHEDDEIWRLLVAITIHKLRRSVKHHDRDKRAVGLEVSQEEIFGVQAEVLARQPAPEEAVALADLVETALSACSPMDRQVVELRLQGCTVEEIAAQVGRSERTVWRVLDRIKQEIERCDDA